jgi:diadenosine tetraphosphate (Ap4A) HIT family hydrolase
MPYSGTKHHYLIVILRHITRISDMTTAELTSFARAVNFLEKELGVDGYSIFVRSGNMKITGATLDHIHFHFVVGEEKKDTGHEMIFAPVGYKTTPVTK